MIRPAEPLPADWVEGQDLVCERQSSPAAPEDLDHWARELDDADRAITRDDATALEQALADVERQSKEAVRPEGSLP